MTLDIVPVASSTSSVPGDRGELEGSSREKGLALRAGAAAPSPVDPMTDDWTRMKQVLDQPVGNALKFTEAGEVVRAPGRRMTRAGRSRLDVRTPASASRRTGSTPIFNVVRAGGVDAPRAGSAARGWAWPSPGRSAR